MAKPTTFLVRATGPRVPQAGSGGSPRRLRWIGDEPVEVPNTRYYRMRLKGGELVQVAPPEAKTKPKAEAKPPARTES